MTGALKRKNMSVCISPVLLRQKWGVEVRFHALIVWHCVKIISSMHSLDPHWEDLQDLLNRMWMGFGVIMMETVHCFCQVLNPIIQPTASETQYKY